MIKRDVDRRCVSHQSSVACGGNPYETMGAEDWVPHTSEEPFVTSRMEVSDEEDWGYAFVDEDGAEVIVPAWREVVDWSNGSQTENWYFINPETKVREMGNAQQVGANKAAPLKQLVGEDKIEVFDPAADVVKTAADLMADAVANGLMVRTYKSDGQLYERAAAPTDFIAKIDVDLKPVEGGAGDLGETDGRATTSEAAVIDDGSEQNLDPGGSRTFGDLKSDNWYIKPDFAVNGELKVAAGSVVEVTLVVASDPVKESDLV